MTRRDPVPLVGDVIKYASLAQSFVSGAGRQDLDTDLKLQLAVSRAIEIIGEACNQLSRILGDRYPDVEWEKIIGMRHRIIHGYAKIDLDRI